MQAALTPHAADYLVSPVAADVSAAAPLAPERRFLQTHWELKILFWGLVLIALAYAATYGITYLLAGI